MAVGGLILSTAFAVCGQAQTKTTKKKSGQRHSTGASSNNAAKTPGGTTSRRKGKSTKSSTHRPSAKRVKGQAAPTTERINQIQQALAGQGAYGGEPNGKWDDSTTEAMKKFQASHGLTPSGKLDAPTLQKLGLGSEIAGMGKPTPPPNAPANRLLSSKARAEEVKNEGKDEPE